MTSRSPHISRVPGYPERRKGFEITRPELQSYNFSFGVRSLVGGSVLGSVLGSVGAPARTTFAVKMRSVKMNPKLIDTPDSIFMIRNPVS